MVNDFLYTKDKSRHTKLMLKHGTCIYFHYIVLQLLCPYIAAGGQAFKMSSVAKQ